MKKLHYHYEDIVMFRSRLSIVGLTIIFIFSILNSVWALTKQEKIDIEANYILGCQHINPQDPAHGVINNIYGHPTWVVPRENAMAILGLIVASDVLSDKVYLDRAHLAADYLVKIQDSSDGAWYDQYSYIDIVKYAKSPTQTAEVMIALYKLGYDHNKYYAMKNGAQYLMECQKVKNKRGNDDGLLCGGKNANAQYHSWRWTHDNAYAYWALRAAEAWASIENDMSFASECAHCAHRIIDGINTYLYEPGTGVWHIAIDENGNSLKNPHLSCLDNDVNAYPSWIQYAPQMLDLPVNGVNSPVVGKWIHSTFQQEDGFCIGHVCEGGEFKERKYPGLSFQAALCWFDMGHASYAEAAIKWAENSGLWQTTRDPNGISAGWIDWIEVEPVSGETAEYWQRFIDTSFYSIASWNGGYDFGLSPLPSPDIKANGSDGPITITSNDNLSVMVKLDPGSHLYDNADWWIAAHTPFDWYYYDVIGGSWSWIPGLSVTYQGPLFNLTPVEVLNISGLPTGTYSFYFGVDTIMNSSLDFDQLYYDSVEVNIAAYEVIYTSQNLSGHSVAAECNPGGATNCPCSEEDVSIASVGSCGKVISNVGETNTYVNAIGYKKFRETFPNGNSIVLCVYKYTGQVKLSILPSPNINQKENPDAVHMMMQLWDGRNELFPSNKTTLEGSIYWDLNPWSEDYGKIKVYTKPVNLIDTGITLTPDTDWHTFELVVDFVSKKYVSITIDGETKDLSTDELAQVSQPSWGEEVSLSITTESMAAFPQMDCTNIFTWTTGFKDLEFSESVQ